MLATEAMSRLTASLLLIGLLTIGCVLADSDSGAQLIGVKTIANHLFVKGKDVTVQYDIYNVGDKAAVNVQLEEDGFSVDYFAIRSGFQHVRWSRLPPGANVSHTLILTPLQTFVFNASNAVLRYKTSDEAVGSTVGYTTAPGEIAVIELADYDRQFSAHAMDWLTFGMMTTPSIIIPFLLWYSSVRKYTSLASHSGRKNN